MNDSREPLPSRTRVSVASLTLQESPKPSGSVLHGGQSLFSIFKPELMNEFLARTEEPRTCAK